MRYAIGLDIGGTKIEGALVSEKGKITKRYRISTESKKGRAKVLKNIVEVITQLSKKRKIHGIGVGIPGFADRKGKIVNMPNVPLKGFNLKDFLKKKFKRPVFIDNDANCFALGEYMFGAGKGSSALIGLIIGTGIGSGIVVDGKVISGCEGGAGEIGHILLDNSAKKLIIGKNDFEAFCSGPNISKRFMKAGGSKKDSHAASIARSKDRTAKKTMADEYRYLGIMLGNLVNTLNPDRIVLGGGVSKALYPKKLKQEIAKFSIPFSAKRVSIVKSRLSEDAAILGAAALTFNQ
ncbi:ROK family protein [Candidatus Woesearchaeota archaeon]|nr:ROK family protein [Candidatus Woesearchaeota archaeon]